MTVDQAVKKHKLTAPDPATAAAKCKELNVDQVLYMNVSSNKVAYIVKDVLGIWLYTDEKSLYTRTFKGVKRTQLSG
ncbi:MAG: hypothetical protein K5656_00300 [Lachnospiraceae bacterium]|jgi:hypothetical protein|nr:hypothetical protein [Lachnospiraceae bacterium]MCR4715598.1 hypothetical protein [Lachnospiraceae bacterium]